MEDAIGARLAAYNRDNDNAVYVEPDIGQPSTKVSGRTYTVRKGDTLSGIAKKNKTTVAKLQKANPGLRPNRLQPGKKIKLP